MSGVALVTGSKAHPLSVRGNDLYETPPEAVYALLDAEDVPLNVWEPACGPGSIARVLRASGRSVFASDLVNYESEDQDAVGEDFLRTTSAPRGVEAIVTNPPYKLASEFVAHALHIAPKVYMLLRLAFLESEKRRPILDGGQLARVLPFRNRLPMMHRDGWGGNKSSSAVAFAWFVWDRNHSGDATIKRISWNKR